MQVHPGAKDQADLGLWRASAQPKDAMPLTLNKRGQTLQKDQICPPPRRQRVCLNPSSAASWLMYRGG